MESQDRAEVDRIKVNVEKCRKTLQNLGYTDFTFEDFFAVNRPPFSVFYCVCFLNLVRSPPILNFIFLENTVVP